MLSTAHRLLLAAALLAGMARAAEPAAEPWKAPPRFAALWLQGGLFLPAGLPGAQPREEVALGMALRPLPFATLLGEGGWVNRSLPGDAASRSQLVSRGASLAVKLHQALGPLEPSLLCGVTLWSTELAVPAPVGGTAGTDAEKASSTGLVLGAGLDWLVSDTLSLGLDWRWHRARASFPRLGGGKLDLGGQAIGLAVRLYWP